MGLSAADGGDWGDGNDGDWSRDDLEGGRERQWDGQGSLNREVGLPGRKGGCEEGEKQEGGEDGLHGVDEVKGDGLHSLLYRSAGALCVEGKNK